jgi:tetratricopeptide (TPR) repeat protein
MVPTVEWGSRSVFVSSTFLDFQVERDYLRKVVFPEVSERLKTLRHHLVPIDLRWGVDTPSGGHSNGTPGASSSFEEESELRVLGVCFDEVMRSRPFMIVLLGDRYGWVPSPEATRKAVGREFRVDSVGKSVTALEIEIGILADPDQCRRVWFYFREQQPYGDPPGSTAAGALEALKARIRRQFPGRVKAYRATSHPDGQGQGQLEEFGRMVAENLWRDLEEELAGAPSQPSLHWAKYEDRVQADFVEVFGRWFRGRRELVEQLLDFALATESDSLVRGAMVLAESGAGKSSLYAHLVGHERLRQSGALVLYHATGVSARSNNADAMLLRWIAQLATVLGQAAPPDDETPKHKLWSTFAASLRAIASTLAADARRVIVLVDGYDQLDSASQGGEAAGLLGYIGNNVRVLVTMSLDGIAEADAPDLARFVMPPLTPDEMRQIASDRAQREHRQLNSRVLEALIAKRGPNGLPAASNTLWIELAMGRLLDFDQRDHASAKGLENGGIFPGEAINQTLINIVGEMPSDVVGMYQWLLQRMEDFPGVAFEWVRLFALFVTIGRKGWREADLLRLMAIGIASLIDKSYPSVQELQHRMNVFVLRPMDKIEPVPALKFAILRRAFAQHLAQVGAEGRYIFARAQMREAVARRYFNFVSAHPDVGQTELEEGLAALGQRTNIELRRSLGEKSLVPGKLVTMCHAIAFEYLRSLPSSDGLRSSESMYHCMFAQHKQPAGGLSHSPALYYASISDPSELRAATRSLAEYVASDQHFSSCVPTGWEMVNRMLGSSVSHGSPNNLRRTLGWLEPEPISRNTRIVVAERFQRHLAGELEKLTVGARRDEIVSKLQTTIEGVLEEVAQLAERHGSPLFRSQAALALGDQSMARGETGKAIELFRQAATEILANSGAGTGADELRLASIAHSRAGDALAAQGRPAEAINAFRTYASLLERRYREFPTEPGAGYDLAIGLCSLGGALFKAEQYDEAELTLLRAFEVLRTNPEVPEDELLQRDVCIFASELAKYLSPFGRRAETEELWRRSYTISRHKLASDPENTEFLLLAARCAAELGESDVASARLADAKQRFEEALECWHSLAVANPEHREASLNESLCLNALGKIAQLEGDAAGARRAFEHGLHALERMVARRADDVEVRRRLAMTHARLSEVAADLREVLFHKKRYVDIFRQLAAEFPEDSKAACDAAISLYRYGNFLNQFNSTLAQSFFRESYDRLIALSEDLPEDPVLRQDIRNTLDRLAQQGMEEPPADKL